MQFAVQSHFVKYLASVALEAAVMVVQLHPGEEADEPIEDARRTDFVPRVVAHLLPAADAVESFVDFGQEPRDFSGIILQVGIESYNDFAASGFKAGG